MSHAQPMSVTIGFSAEQLNDLGVPDGMDEITLADIVDSAMLSDTEALKTEIQQWTEDHEDQDR